MRSCLTHFPGCILKPNLTMLFFCIYFLQILPTSWLEKTTTDTMTSMPRSTWDQEITQRTTLGVSKLINFEYQSIRLVE